MLTNCYHFAGRPICGLLVLASMVVGVVSSTVVTGVTVAPDIPVVARRREVGRVAMRQGERT